MGDTLKKTDLGNITKHVLEDLSYIIGELNAEVLLSPLPEVSVDASQISRLFQNLISNSMKFRRDEPPRIEISAREVPGYWEFCIKDNGIGIEEKFYDRIFEVFQRLHAQQDYTGTGIGLSLCKRIVERHKGEIWVESVTGEGSTFYFTLPREE